MYVPSEVSILVKDDLADLRFLSSWSWSSGILTVLQHKSIWIVFRDGGYFDGTIATINRMNRMTMKWRLGGFVFILNHVPLFRRWARFKSIMHKYGTILNICIYRKIPFPLCNKYYYNTMCSQKTTWNLGKPIKCSLSNLNTLIGLHTIIWMEISSLLTNETSLNLAGNKCITNNRNQSNAWSKHSEIEPV